MYEVLKIYEKYSREELNNIFNPELNYYRGAGKWGGSGIVNIQYVVVKCKQNKVMKSPLMTKEESYQG